MTFEEGSCLYEIRFPVSTGPVFSFRFLLYFSLKWYVII